MRLRQLYLWHRYLGVALCALFLVWFVSGIVMLYVRMPILFPAERFQYLSDIDPARFVVTPLEAAARAGLTEAPRRIRLNTLRGRPIYYLLPKGRKWVGVFGDDGSPLDRITPEAAALIVTRGAPSAAARYLGSVEAIDQWTLTNSLNLHRPLHRIAVGDDHGTEMYVSEVTGEIVMRTTKRERALAWLGPIAHWGAPEALRTRVAAWRQVILWLSGAGIILVISGLWIGIVRYRHRGYMLKAGVARSPYTGWKKWHHWGGLVFGAVTLTWMFSGWLYLNPGGYRSGPLETITTMSPYNVGGVRADQSSRPEHVLALSGGPIDPALYTMAVARAWAEVPETAAPREIELVRVGGVPYFVFYADWNRSWIVPADKPVSIVQQQFETAALVGVAQTMLRDATLTDATLVDRYDAYYYSVGAVAPKRLPFLRIKFDDPSRTWFYIDPYSGSILRRYDAYGRMMRWMVNGLHTLDFPFLFAHRPAWDLAIILLSAGGLLLSGSGLVMGWRRLR